MRASLVLIIALAVLPGCLLPDRSVVEVTYYSIDPPMAKASGRTPANLAVAVSALEAASRYDPSILYHEGGRTVAYLEGERWIEAPSEMLSRALRRALEAQRVARVVADERLLRRPDILVEGRITRFDLVQGKTQWAAECELELVVKRATRGEVLLARRIAVRKPAAARTTAAFVDAMNAACADLVTQAAAAVTAAIESRVPM